MSTARDGLTPAASFIDQQRIVHRSAPSLIEFFNLAATFLAARGVTLRRVPPVEMVRLNREHQESWWRQVPVLDAEDYPPVADELVCFVGYTDAGEAVTAKSMRLLDIKGATLKSAMENLTLFYGPDADAARRNVEFEITAPFADRAMQSLAYLGGFWVHPEFRGSGLSFVVPRITHYAALAEWGVPYQVSIVRQIFTRPDVLASYDVEGAEPYFYYKINDRIQWEGSLVYASAEFLERRLQRDIDDLTSKNSLERRRQQDLRVAAPRAEK